MDKCKIGLGYNSVLHPYTGNFMPPKPDLVYPSLDDFVDVNESVSESVVENPTVESNEPKTVRKENGAPIIKDWVSKSINLLLLVMVNAVEVDGKKVIISEASIKRDLKFRDEGGIDCFSNDVIFEQLTLMGKHKSRKTKRKDTELPQTSVPIEYIADEAVNEEMDESLERGTTTATSLDANQDRGNISKTQSKATPNEPSSPGTSSSDGPRHQDTMGDTVAQTRSENVSKFFNDPLLAGVNTPQSGEDSLKLTEFMEFCTNLQQRVFDLETIKTSQAQEITSLKKSVKRLEKKRRIRTHGLKRLYKVGLSERVESSADEESLGEEDASKQRMISDIDSNQNIYLVNIHRDEDICGVNDQDDTSMFDADKDLQGEEVVVEKAVADKDVSAVEEVNTASIATSVTATTTTVATTPTISMDEITLAKALIKIKTSRPKAKGIIMQEPSETPTPRELLCKSQTRALKNKSFDDIQDLFNKAMKRVNMFVDMNTEVVESSKKTEEIAQEGSSKRAGDELDQE
nr:hypothetical protein [Tanacetum cinerariifolium]